MSSLIFSLQFLNFRSKIQVLSKKKDLLEFRSYLSIFAPNVFQQSRGTRLRNLHYCQKTGNSRWAPSELGCRLDIPGLESNFFNLQFCDFRTFIPIKIFIVIRPICCKLIRLKKLYLNCFLSAINKCGSALNVSTHTPLPLKYLHQINSILEKSSNLIKQASFFFRRQVLTEERKK